MRKAIISLIFLFPSLIVFLFLLRIANAQIITGCTNITSPGKYDLINDINLTGEPGEACIVINTDNVTINLGGFTIDGRGTWTYGIRSLGFKNIKVYNGKIKYFWAGIVAMGQNLHFSRLDLYGNDIGLYIGLSSNVTIENSRFENVYGIQLAGWNDKFVIKNNWFVDIGKNIDITTGYNSWLDDSLIILNKFGNISIAKECCIKKIVWIGGIPVETETCVMPCAGTYAGAAIGFDCAPTQSIKGCERNIFVGNFIYATDKDVHLSRSEYNKFIRNTFVNTHLEPETGLYLEGDARHNWGCENQGKIYDFGVNNTFLDVCPADIGYNVSRPCTPGWQCLDNKTLAYVVNTECEVSKIINCTIACVNGKCVEEAPPPPKPPAPEVPEIPPKVSEPIPFFNRTQLEETGWGWMIPFVSPMAFAFYIIFGVSAFVASKVKQQSGIVFALTFLTGILIASLANIIPSWVGITLILIAGGIVAYLISKIAGE